MSGYKVVVCGAAGGIGQPLSTLLKINPLVSELRLYDVAPVVKGVAVDLSHVSSDCTVKGFAGNDELEACMEGADVIVVPAGVPRKPGMTRDDLFNINAGINKGLAEACIKGCPNAYFLIISNPVNSMVPVWAETLKAAGVYQKEHLFGVTTLDTVRARTFVAEKLGKKLAEVNVSVVGGHAGTTILPLLSQVEDSSKFTADDVAALTKRIQFGGDEVVEAKAGAGSATLSMAYAGHQFTDSVLKALSGVTGIVEATYVDYEISEAPGCRFFASPVQLGTNGVDKVLPLGTLSQSEQDGLKAMLPDLIAQVQKGVDFGAPKGNGESKM